MTINSVLITGATSGIGLQLAHDYAKQGVAVIACGRNQAKLDELAQQYSCVTPLAFDMIDHEQTTAALQSISSPPTTWILNAGDCEYIDDGIIDAKLIARVMNINVVGLANCIEGIQSHFVSGHKVVIVGSIASELALPRSEAYGTSKAAVSYFARSLSLALSPKGIDVVMVFPGFVSTPLTDKNTFSMPMIITTEQASQAIQKGIAANKAFIYFPARFTWILRVIGLLPYRWQAKVVSKLITE